MSAEPLEARVATTGRRGLTLLHAGRSFPAIASGSLMHGGNGPVVGDRVEYAIRRDRAVVERILPRSRCLVRTAGRGERRMVAANVDRVVIMVSLIRPRFVRGVIDRVAASAEHQGLEICIAVNKTDLLPEGEDLPRALEDYRSAGYRVFPVSCSSGEGVEALRTAIDSKTVVIAGHSGVGKTSLVRRFAPQLELRVAPLGGAKGRGRHTTVAARLIALDEAETFLVDTPGFRVFSLAHIPPDSLQECFPEFRHLLGHCRFRDCVHVSEPGCAIRDSVENGSLPAARYEAYLSLYEEIVGRSRRGGPGAAR